MERPLSEAAGAAQGEGDGRCHGWGHGRSQSEENPHEYCVTGRLGSDDRSHVALFQAVRGRLTKNPRYIDLTGGFSFSAFQLLGDVMQTHFVHSYRTRSAATPCPGGWKTSLPSAHRTSWQVPNPSRAMLRPNHSFRYSNARQLKACDCSARPPWRAACRPPPPLRPSYRRRSAPVAGRRSRSCRPW